jgi:hypothetical protein
MQTLNLDEEIFGGASLTCEDHLAFWQMEHAVDCLSLWFSLGGEECAVARSVRGKCDNPGLYAECLAVAAISAESVLWVDYFEGTMS